MAQETATPAMDSARRSALLAQAPKPEDFPLDQRGMDGDYQEALGYWRSHQGRVLAAADLADKARLSDPTALPEVPTRDRPMATTDKKAASDKAQPTEKSWFQSFIEAGGSVTVTPQRDEPQAGPPSASIG